MAHTINDFLEYYPEFSGIDNQSIINVYLEEADLMIDFNRCPKFEKLIRFAYAAHALVKSSVAPNGQDDGVGVVTSATVGNVSETRQVGQKKTRSYSDDWFGSTAYGARFLQLRARCIGSGAMTT